MSFESDRFACSLTRNRADAENLVQETYVRAYRSWHTFIPGSNALRWLFTICRHRHIHEVLRTRRHAEYEDDDVASTLDIHEQTAERDLVAAFCGRSIACRSPSGPRLIRGMVAHTFTSATGEIPS
ncbi:MAG TPA: sigma factor [Gemmatimonadaceae bacterium]|nr:sigma factor [Gemmatimonadaceae bacterium]